MILYSKVPDPACPFAISPTFFPINAFPIGDSFESLSSKISDSVEPTIRKVSFLPSLTELIVTRLPTLIPQSFLLAFLVSTIS